MERWDLYNEKGKFTPSVVQGLEMCIEYISNNSSQI